MKKKHVIALIIIVLSGGIIFSYVAQKAWLASFTHDESYTYNRYVHTAFMDILSYKNSYTNNHLLNTLLMKYSEMLFGSSEFALRLPNLLALLLSFIYVYLLFRNRSIILQISVVVFLFTNAALLDIYGLARGYGISAGFMIIAVYHLIRMFDSKRVIHTVLFHIASLLAVLANFTMLDFYVAALLTFNLVHFYNARFVLKTRFSPYSINKLNLLMLVPVLIILYEPVRRVITYNHFDFGGSQGFMSDTFAAILDTFLVNTQLSGITAQIIKIVLLITLFIPPVIIAIQAYSKRTDFFENNKSLIFINSVLVLIFIEVILQHWLFKTDYLVGRFALFLFPLMVLNIAFLINSVLQYHLNDVLLPFCAVFALLSSVHLYRHADLYSCAEWGYDSETKTAMQFLQESYNNDTTHNVPLKMSVNWLFEPTVNFYRQTHDMNWLLPVDRKELPLNSDYCYIFKTDLDTLKLGQYKVIFSSDKTNTLLIKNEQ